MVDYPASVADKHPEDLLPLELWDLIFKLVVADHRLLRVACVCHAFNELAISLYLRRNKVNLPVSKDTTIHPHTMSGLRLGCIHRDLDIGTLSCHFFTWQLRSTRSLAGVVEKCTYLTELHLKLSTNSPHNDDDLIAALCDVFRAMAKKSPGPVFVVGKSAFHRFELKDTIPWQPPHIRTRSQPQHFPAIIEEQCDPFKLQVRVESIRPDSGSAFTLVTFDTSSLSLSPTSALSAAETATILRHLRLRLPQLRSVVIPTNIITPASIGQFIGHHPELRSIHYILGGSPRPPLLRRLLSVFSRVSAIYFGRHAPAAPRHVGGFYVRNEKPILGGAHGIYHVVSLRAFSGRQCQIHLHVPDGLRTLCDAAPTDAERVALRDLRRLVHITLFAYSVEDVRILLPWLALMPALRELELANINTDPTVVFDSVAFLEEVRAALPLIVHVWSLDLRFM